jgi:hypothetical protein
LAVAKQVLPGAVESEILTEGAVISAARLSLPRLFAAASAGLELSTPAGIAGAIAGPTFGAIAEQDAKQWGLGKTASIGVGFVGAAGGGAAAAVTIAILAATAPVSGSVLLGVAIVGGIAGGLGYLLSR